MQPINEKPSLFEHQKHCLEIAKTNDRWLFACDTGTGKTRIGYEVIKSLTSGSKTLVICPLPIIQAAWLEQAKQWAPGLKVVNGRKKDPADVTVVNYEFIMNKWKKAHPKVRQSAPAERRRLDEEWQRWCAQFHCIILDESVKIKSPVSKVYDAIRDLTANTARVYLLSGCPAPNSALDYYTQQRIIQNPQFPWPTFRVFRSQFYFQPSTEQQWLWVPLYPDTENRIVELCKARTTYIKKEDCLDLPPQVYETHMVTMNAAERKAYTEMRDEFIIMLRDNPDDAVVANNILSQMMKLRQMTAGFIARTGEWHILGETKLNELMEILNEIGNKQVLIFGQFRKEIERIAAALGARSCVLYGEMSDAQRDESVNGFIAGRYQYMVAHPASAKYGFTFTNASYCIWASMSYNYDEWYQGNQRIHRIGQTVSTTHIALLAEDSIDEVIYDAVQNKHDLSTKLLEMLK